MHAFTTARAAGTFGTRSSEPSSVLSARWQQLIDAAVARGASRFATASQVQGADIVVHCAASWTGWLRSTGVDGHLWLKPGTAAAVTVADCVPVFLAHPSGAAAVLHSGWRGTVAGITERAIERFASAGFAASSLRLHLGPAICGSCYEVSPEVYGAVTGSTVKEPTTVDLRAAIATRARALGVRDIAISEWCTRCSNDQLFSHRAGDAGRQLGVLMTADQHR